MPTAQNLIDATRQHLQALSRDEVNQLNGSITNSATSLTVEFTAGGIQRGALLAIDLEVIHVWSVASLTATVKRGMMGSTAASHADDALVYVNPRFTDWQILQALNDELAALSSPENALFRVRTVDLTAAAARDGYDLTSVTDMIDILEVRWKGYTTGSWPMLTSWTVARDMATTEFASGMALLLYDTPGPGRAVRVRYSAPYALLTTAAQDVLTQTGLHTQAHDIPPLGAAARLLAGREARRASYDAQPESRQAADVPPGTNRQAAGGLLALRDMRIREESARLHALYPRIHRRAS